MLIFLVHPLSPDSMPSYDEKSDPFLFQSLFSLLISAFVMLFCKSICVLVYSSFTPYMETDINLTLAVFGS